jgi:hypothetical protein
MSAQPQIDVPWWRNDPWLGKHHYHENRNKNVHLLAKYNNVYVAWFPDGSGIRAVDEDYTAMRERFRAAGEDPEWYIYEFVTDEPNI